MKDIVRVILVSCVAAVAALSVHAQAVDTVVNAPALSQNLVGDSAQRSVLVYLPPQYEADSTRRFPAIYLLHSYGATNRSWLGEAGYEGMDLPAVLDSLISSGEMEPVIVVMPDAKNVFGGSWYADSPATGMWEAFIAQDLIAFVDSTYRTLPERRGRGIAGQSMGGYGAMRIAMSYPQIFRAVLAMSAPNLVNPDPLGPFAHEAAASIAGGSLDSIPIFGRVIWSKAAAFSPNPTASPLYADLPYERSEGELHRRESVWQKWLANTLERRIPDKPLDLEIRLEVGSRDALRGETLAFAATLTEREIPFSLEVFEGGHVNGVRRQFETSVFAFFDDIFRR